MQLLLTVNDKQFTKNTTLKYTCCTEMTQWHRTVIKTDWKLTMLQLEPDRGISIVIVGDILYQLLDSRQQF